MRRQHTAAREGQYILSAKKLAWYLESPRSSAILPTIKNITLIALSRSALVDVVIIMIIITVTITVTMMPSNEGEKVEGWGGGTKRQLEIVPRFDGREWRFDFDS